MEDSMSRRKGSWIVDSASRDVQRSKEDFIMVGSLQKRRGGFGKMAQQSWRSRYFVLSNDGNSYYLSYYEANDFESINFNQPARGILALDGDVVISRSTKPDSDLNEDVALIVQGGGQRWKLCSDIPGEINRWEEALRSVVNKSPVIPRAGPTVVRDPLAQSSVAGSPEATAKTPVDATNDLAQTPSIPTTNGARRPPEEATISPSGKPDGIEPSGLWDFVLALVAVDVACYVLHTRKGGVELFYTAILIANMVVGSRILRRSSTSGVDSVATSVPLIHDEEVAPLRVALKKRFAVKKEVPTVQPVGASSDMECGLPHASSTMPRYDGPREPALIPHHTWTNGTSSIFRLRGKGYLEDRKKVTPDEALYDMVGMDVFATEARVGNIAAEVMMENIAKDLPQVPVPGVPPILVLNVQLPSAPPNLMSSAEDGPGYQCVYYYRIKESTVRKMGNLDEASEGIRLWTQYCQHMGVDDKYHGRFKCICVIANYESLGIPAFVTRYNGKPVLINKSGNWVRGPYYLENDINVHRFSFIAKKGLHHLKAVFKDMVLHVGFTIEGRSPEELPESLVGCATLNFPTLDQAKEFEV